MKRIILILIAQCLILSTFAQTYGGEIRAKDNSAVIGNIYRTGSALKTSDSAVAAKLAAGIPVTGLPAEGTISTNNSSTGTLGVGAVFTGTADEITNYSSVSVYVISNVASATDGLSIQQSSDGTNWDITDVYSVPAATGKTYGVQVTGRYFRIVYTNGGTIQASFRLQTIHHKYMDRNSSTRPQDARTNDNDFTENLSYSMGYNGTSWDRLRSDITNGLDVDVTRLPIDLTNTGNITAISQNIALALAGQSGASVQVTGTWVGTLQFEGTTDGTTWVAINAVSSSTSSPQPTTTANGLYRLTPGGLTSFRVTSTAWTSGTAVITMKAGIGVGGTFVNQNLPVVALKDKGRNISNLFMVAPIITTTAEVMQSLTGYKSGAAVTATATPAVVTTAKTYRITQITITYFNVAAVGSARFTLRANTAGVGVIGSPLVWNTQVGISGDGTSTAGHVTTVTYPFPDGLEFAAGTGIAVGMQGFGAVPTTGTIVGYGKIEIYGYEY